MAKVINNVGSVNSVLTTPRVNIAAVMPWLRRILFFAALVGLWQIVTLTGIWPDYVLPGPLEVFNSLVTGISSGIYIQAAQVSLERLVIGYGISLVIGMVLGALIGRIHL